MQTATTIETVNRYGAEHVETLSIRRRPGMPGAYVRVKHKQLGRLFNRAQNTGWHYIANFDQVRYSAKRINCRLSAYVLTCIPDDAIEGD